MIRTGSFLLSLCFLFLVSACDTPQKNDTKASIGRLPAPSLKRMSQNQYGIEMDSRTIVQANFEENQFLTDILTAHNVAPETIDKLAKKSEHIFDVRRMRAGNAFTLLKNENQEVDYFIYEKNPADYVVFDLRDSVKIYEGRNKTDAEEKELAGVIQNSLYETITEQKMDQQLARMLEDVFAWSVDLFHLEKGDYFKVIYKEEYVDDASLGITQILAAQFHHDGEDYYAFRFGEGNEFSYFDQHGNNVKTTFLQAPVRYNFKKGSDGQKSEKEAKYEAPAGSPVYALGGGVITKVRRNSGYQLNIRHTYPYSTQYGQLAKLAKGIKKGSRIKQGDLIGYVGENKISLNFLRKNKSVDRSELSLDEEDDTIDESKRKDFELFKENLILRLARIPLSAQDKQLLSSY